MSLDVELEIDDKPTAKKIIEEFTLEAIDNFMVALKDVDLPITKKRLEEDFVAFLGGHVEGVDEDDEYDETER